MSHLKILGYCAFFFISHSALGASPILITETTLPLRFDTGNPSPYGLPSTTVSIQGKSLPLLLDTGASPAGVVLSPTALAGLDVKFTGTQKCTKTFDGKLCAKEFIIPQLKIGEFIVKNVPGMLVKQLWDQKNNATFIETPASGNGVIGYKLLSQFNLLLDYPHAKAILVKPNHSPLQYDISQWMAIPFQNHLKTPLKLNGKTYTFIWDTGSTPSIIKSNIANNNKPTACPAGRPYNGKNCLGIKTTTLATLTGKKLPSSWFMARDIPTFAPFDGVMGSNFYNENLVYFNFDQQKIYIQPAFP